MVSQAIVCFVSGGELKHHALNSDGIEVGTLGEVVLPSFHVVSFLPGLGLSTIRNLEAWFTLLKHFGEKLGVRWKFEGQSQKREARMAHFAG